MLDSMNFYKFLHKQLIIMIGLTLSTAGGYIYIGFLYETGLFEKEWFLFVILVSIWGYILHRQYTFSGISPEAKEKWVKNVKIFFFIYAHTWTIMFIMYTSTTDIDLHYIAIATQLGTSVVSVTMLASQRKLSIITLISLMLPLVIYFALIGEFYSYLLSFFSIVLGWVLLYASGNTFNYLVRSQHQAYHDYLTNIGNRRYFIELLEESIQIQKYDKKPIFLLLIDLDHFKTINDSLGHDIGDLLLKEVASRMTKLSDEKSYKVSRLGGDEFCVLSTSFHDVKEALRDAKRFAHKLLQTLKQTYYIDENHLYISASIGISIINASELKASTFIKEADIAMYEAKLKGRDGIILFNDELSLRVERKLEIEKQLHFALEKKEISLMYQPQIDSTDKIIGCEVLVRWNNSKLGNIGPDEFIPISEDTGLIIELGSYILEEAIKTFSEWEKKGIGLEQISINISVKQLFHNGFIDEVQHIFNTYLSKEQANKIIFEITETSVAENIDELITNMKTLKEYGIRFSMDDFGTGYSSLSYLRQIPINELKIDKSFIDELGTDGENGAIVRTILDIAKNLNLSIVAEGVENIKQKDFLIEEENDIIIQGYHFAKPLLKNDFEILSAKSLS